MQKVIGKCGGCSREVYANVPHECAATAAYRAAERHGALAAFTALVRAGTDPDVAAPIAIELTAEGVR